MVVTFRPMLRSPMPPHVASRDQTIAWAAQDVEMAAIDLMRAVEACGTVSDALKLYAVAETLRSELDRVAVAALDMADHNCGQ